MSEATVCDRCGYTGEKTRSVNDEFPVKIKMQKDLTKAKEYWIGSLNHIKSATTEKTLYHVVCHTCANQNRIPHEHFTEEPHIAWILYYAGKLHGHDVVVQPLKGGDA